METMDAMVKLTSIANDVEKICDAGEINCIYIAGKNGKATVLYIGSKKELFSMMYSCVKTMNNNYRPAVKNDMDFFYRLFRNDEKMKG